jgi:hypothetical protein
LWLLFLTASLLFLPQPSPAKTKPTPSLDSGYAPALAAANHLLQAWQSADAESGMILLTTRAKQSATTDGIERFFSDAGPSAYEISRGKLLKPGRYEFPVVLVLGGANLGGASMGGASMGRASKAPRRRFSTIVVVNTGHNDWAVDKLP